MLYAESFDNVETTVRINPVHPSTAIHQGPIASIYNFNGGYLYFDPADGTNQYFTTSSFDISTGALVTFYAATNTSNSSLMLDIRMYNSYYDTWNILDLNPYNTVGKFPSSWTQFSANIPPTPGATAYLVFYYTCDANYLRPMAIDNLVVTGRSCNPYTLPTPGNCSVVFYSSFDSMDGFTVYPTSSFHIGPTADFSINSYYSGGFGYFDARDGNNTYLRTPVLDVTGGISVSFVTRTEAEQHAAERLILTFHGRVDFVMNRINNGLQTTYGYPVSWITYTWSMDASDVNYYGTSGFLEFNFNPPVGKVVALDSFIVVRGSTMCYSGNACVTYKSNF